MLCSEFAQIVFADQKGDSISDVGLLEDVCPAGVTISLSVPIPLDMKVRIHTNGFEADAVVRHCELGDYGFLVGMEFADGYEWDQRKWTPGHLLALPVEED